MRPVVTLSMILLAALALGIAYIIIIPPWQSPDEPTHFEYAQVLADGAPPWNLSPSPELQEKIISSLDRHGYWRYVGVEPPPVLPNVFRETPFLSAAPSQIGKNPPLYYWIASRVLKISPQLPLEGRLYRLRALSLFFSLLTIACVWLCAREIFGAASPLCFAAAGATAFLPQFLVIGTSISPDPLVNLLGAGVIWLVIRIQKTGLRLGKMFLLLFLHGFGLLVNYKFLILIPALGGAWFIHYLVKGREYLPVKKLGSWLFLLALVILLGYSLLVWYAPAIARVFIVRINILYTTVRSFLTEGTLVPEGYWHWFNNELFKTFWLKYGWLRFALAPFYYIVFKLVSLAALAGIVFFLTFCLAGRSGTSRGIQESVLTLLLYAAVTIGAYYLFWGLRVTSPTTQGRHLFLVLPAWFILFVFGWCRLFPARWEKRICIAILSFFLAVSVLSLFGYILPTFR